MALQRERESSREGLLKVLAEDKRVLEVNAWQENAQAQRAKVFLRRNRFEEQRRMREESRVAGMKQREEERRRMTKAEEAAARKEKEAFAHRIKMERIIEGDARLRDLKNKLNLLYVRQAQAKQLEQKSLLALEKKEEEAMVDKMYLDMVSKQEETLAEEEESRKKRLHKINGELLEQISEKRQLDEEEAKLQSAKDKAQVDAIMKQVLEEEEQFRVEKKRKQEATRQDIEEYQDQWKKAKRLNEEMIRKEEEEIRKYLEEIASREAKKEEQKKAELEYQQKIYEQILQEHNLVKEKEEKLLRAQEILNIQFHEEKLKRLEREKVRKLLRMKEEMISAYEAQKKANDEKKLKAMKEKLAIREKLRQKYEEDERKEQGIQLQRARMKDSFKKGLQKQQVDRFERYRLEKEQEEAKLKAREEKEMYEQQVVDEATKALLQKHRDVIEQYGRDIIRL